MANSRIINRVAAACLATAVLVPVCSFAAQEAKFIGTPLLCEVLSEIGERELAYTLLLQRKFPSWLYSIDQGATTMWERWDGYTKECGFGDVEMNSYNHYAYGADGRCRWTYSVPEGCTATVVLPDGKTSVVKSGEGELVVR